MQGDREPDAERLDELADGGREPLPLRVRLRPHEQVEAGRVGQGDLVDDERRGVERCEPVRAEAHPRATRAVVHELVDVERRDDAVRKPLQQVVHRKRGRRAGVDEPVERVDEDGCSGHLVGAAIERVLGEHVEVVRVEHVRVNASVRLRHPRLSPVGLYHDARARVKTGP